MVSRPMPRDQCAIYVIVHNEVENEALSWHAMLVATSTSKAQIVEHLELTQECQEGFMCRLFFQQEEVVDRIEVAQGNCFCALVPVVKKRVGPHFL